MVVPKMVREPKPVSARVEEPFVPSLGLLQQESLLERVKRAIAGK